MANICIQRKNIIYYVILLLTCILAFRIAYEMEQDTRTYSFDVSVFTHEFDTEIGTWQIKSDELSLPKGNYMIAFAMSSDSDVNIALFLDNDIYENRYCTNAEFLNDNVTIPFSLAEPTDQAYILISSSYDVKISDVVLFSDRYLFNDFYYYAVLIVAALITIVLIQARFPFSKYKKHWIVFCSMIIIVNIPLVLAKGEPILVDIRAHLLRIEGIYKGFLDGQCHVLVYPNANNQFGQTGVLYPALFLYFPAFLRLLNVSMLAAVKTTEAIVHICTILICYVCGKKILKNENTALVVTALYTFDFHRIGVSYNGGGLLGNGVAIMFFPVVVLGIYSIFYETKKYWWALPLGLSLVFYSHVLSFAMMCLLVLVFTVFNLKRLLEKDMLFCILKCILLFLLLSAGNIFAFLCFYLLGVEKDILVFIDWMNTVINIDKLIELGENTYINDAVLLFITVLSIAIIVLRTRNKEAFSRFVIHGVIVASIFMIIMSEITPWKLLLNISFIHKITDTLQYSARFFYITQFLIDIALASVICSVYIKKKYRYVIIAISACLFILHFGVKGINFIYGEPLLRDEICGDYNSWRNNDYLLKGTKDEWLLSSVGNVSDETLVSSYDYKKVRGKVTYSYSTDSSGQYAEFPLVFYPGYEAVNDLGEKMVVEKGDKNMVRVYLPKTSEPREIYVMFRVGVIYYLLDLISACAFIWLVIYVNCQKKPVLN